MIPLLIIFNAIEHPNHLFSTHGMTILSVLLLLVYALGVLNAAHAVMNVRSSQSAIAWSLSLITFPGIALPLYWILGRVEFHGYTQAYHQAYAQNHDLAHNTYLEILSYKAVLPTQLASLQRIAGALTEFPFTHSNSVQLLINAEQTYSAMQEAILNAKKYILLQSYILNDDQVGQTFQHKLMQKAEQGIRIYVLYDEIGSKRLTKTYIKTLQSQGIQVSAFHSAKGWGNRFQLNFRNHRKILVVDGRVAFVGGVNIGDEYLGQDPHFGSWRDTHLKVQGPAVQCLQLPFLKDWYWAVRQIPVTCWEVQADRERNQTVFVFSPGPTDPQQDCTLFFGSIINLAQHRLWIASPYFVPDEPILTALKMAALRGVDVRVILPNRPDHLLVYLCSFSYYTEMESTGIKLYRYKSGFMHQKVILVDDYIAGVGTVNLDNRSFHLNFEVMTFVSDVEFARNVEQMLCDDFEHSMEINLSEYELKPNWFKLIVRVSRLLAPLQ